MWAEDEGIVGADVADSIMRFDNGANVIFTEALNFGAATLTGTCNRVTLMRFKNAAGTEKILRVDNCGTVSVA